MFPDVQEHNTDKIFFALIVTIFRTLTARKVSCNKPLIIKARINKSLDAHKLCFHDNLWKTYIRLWNTDHVSLFTSPRKGRRVSVMWYGA